MFKILTVFVLAFTVQTAVVSAEAAAEKKDAAVEASANTQSAGRFALMYLPNVFADLLDIVSMEVSVGNTFAIDFHVTAWCDFGLENSDAYFAGFGPLHRYGAGRREAQRMAALCWSYENVYVSQTVGTVPTFSLEDTSFNLVRSYTNTFKDRDIDPYALGVKAAMFAGVSFDLHPMAIADFFCGLAGYDLSGDNWK